MPFLAQYKDNPAFVQSPRRKSSKHRVTSNVVPQQKPPVDAIGRPSEDIAPTIDTLPDADVSEVIESMATMLSQGSPPPVDHAEELLRQQRAPTADMTTALSQQRRTEMAEEQMRAVLTAQMPSSNLHTIGPSHEDMSTDDESTDSGSPRQESSGAGAYTAGDQRQDVNSGRHDQPAEVVDSPEVDMNNPTANLFVPANANRPPQRESQASNQAAPVTLSQSFAAVVAKLDAKRDEQDPDFRPDAVDGLHQRANRKTRSPQHKSSPKKRHIHEIRRETPKKPRVGAATPGEAAETPTTIKGKQFLLLKDAAQQERRNLIIQCERTWGMSMKEVIPTRYWPRTVKRDNTPLEPRDWPTTLLRQMLQLAEHTSTRPELPALAIRQAIYQRRTWYSDQKWLLFVEDAQAAVKLAMSWKVVVSQETSVRTDSPISEVVIRQSKPSTVIPHAEASSCRGGSENELPDEIVEGDLYNSTPPPKRRLIVVLPCNLPDLAEPANRAGAVDIVDLTVEDAADEDVKRPVAQCDTMSVSAGCHSPQANRFHTLREILKVFELDVFNLTVSNLLDLGAAAREWQMKAKNAANLVDQRMEVADFENDDVLDVYYHTCDLLRWVREEFDRRKAM